MKKRNSKKIFSRFGKSLVEIFCVVLVISMVLGAVSVVIENMATNKSTNTSSYVIYGCVEHPYVKRLLKNATVVLWNLRTNETNVSYTNETGYYSVNLNDAGISHQTGDQIRILTYYMHYSDNRTITIAGNSSHEVEIKLKNNNHFNNYMAPDDIDLNLTIPEFNETFEDALNLTEPDLNFTESEMPDFENYTYPENSTKRLPNLTVSDVSYDKLILGNQTQLNVTIKNINNVTACNITTDVYYETHNNELLGTLCYGNIISNETKTNSILWTPVVPEINNLKIVIYTENQKENTIIIGFYVRPAVISNYGGHTFTPPEAAPPVQGDWEIKTDVIVENEEIWLEGDLIIYPGATLTFKKNVKLIMMPPEPGIPFIDTSGTATATILWSPVAGTYNVQGSVDPQNNIPEANENNNQLTQLITVSSKSLYYIMVDYFTWQVESKYIKLLQPNNKMCKEGVDIQANATRTIISHIDDTIATPL